MLQSYLKVVDQRLITELAPQFNLMFKAGSMPKLAQKDTTVKPSKSSPFDKKQVVPAFNTVDGSVADNVKIVKYSSRDDALYIFQTLLINNEEALVFYDSGATGNLVLGSFAERNNFKVINPRTQLIGALGNHMMYTEYGTYLGQLGPDSEGAYHEILFQGISKITDKYPKYDLRFIASEVQNCGKLPREGNLPSQVGGRPVDMLIGIQNPELVPKRLFFLPSGIGVYEAPFQDSASTHYAFGGSHYSITRTNKQFGHISFNRMTILLTQIAAAYYGAPWLDINLEIPSKPKQLLLTLEPPCSSLHSPAPLTSESSGPLIQHESDLVIEPVSKKYCAFDESAHTPTQENNIETGEDLVMNETGEDLVMNETGEDLMMNETSEDLMMNDTGEDFMMNKEVKKAKVPLAKCREIIFTTDFQILILGIITLCFALFLNPFNEVVYRYLDELHICMYNSASISLIIVAGIFALIAILEYFGMHLKHNNKILRYIWNTVQVGMRFFKVSYASERSLAVDTGWKKFKVNETNAVCSRSHTY